MKKNLVFSRNDVFKKSDYINFYPDYFFYDEKSKDEFVELKIDDFNELEEREKIKDKYLEISFNYFYKFLNEFLYKKIKYPEKYWKIILKHWYEIFFDLYLQRYLTLKKILNNTSYNSVTLINDHFKYIETNFSNEIFNKCQDEIWNYCLFQEIFKNIAQKKIEINFINLNINFYKKIKRVKLSKFLLIFYNKLIKVLNSNKKNQHIIMNSYLGVKNEFFLQIKLKQFPYIYTEKVYENINLKNTYDVSKRKKLSHMFEKKVEDQFIKNYLKTISFFLPNSFLESFDEINKFEKKFFGFKNINFIFTSVSYAFDDIFKRFMANSNNIYDTKLIIGQHGIGYPLERNTSIIGTSRAELEFCDQYLSWGDFSDNKINKILSSTVLIKRSYLNDFKKGKTKKKLLQIIQPHREAQYKMFNTKIYFFNFLNNFNFFLNKINNDILSNVFVKIHPYDLNSKIRKNIWKKAIENYKLSSNVDYNFSKKKMYNVNKKTKVFLFNYFSTGFLECISENIPCLMYCQNYEKYLRNEHKEIIKSLIDCNIIFNKYDNLIKFLNNNWNRINEWWCDEDLQDKRKNFSEFFAKKHNPKNILSILDEINKK